MLSDMGLFAYRGERVFEGFFFVVLIAYGSEVYSVVLEGCYCMRVRGFFFALLRKR